MVSYSLTEAAEILQMKRRTLAFYADIGIVTPEINQGTGRGSRRLFSKNNLMQFMLVKVLNQRGLRIEHIKIFFDEGKHSKGAIAAPIDDTLLDRLPMHPSQFREFSKSFLAIDFSVITDGIEYLVIWKWNQNSEDKNNTQLIRYINELDEQKGMEEISRYLSKVKSFETMTIINLTLIKERIRKDIK